MALQKLKPIGLVDILGIILLLVLTFVRGTMAGDPGVGWHLRNGEWILKHGAVPQQDYFLFTTAGKEWVANQWLSDVLFYKLLSLGDWALLHLAVIFLVLGPIFVFFAPLLRKNGISPLVSFLALLIFALVSSVQWILRPVIFSFALFAASYFLLQSWYQATPDSERRARFQLCFMPLLFLLWVNLHPGVILGLGLLGLYVIGTLLAVLKKERSKAQLFFIGSISAISAGVCLINPYGLKLFQYASGLASNQYFMNLNFEWLSTDAHIFILLPFAISFLFLVLLASRVENPKLYFPETVLLLAFAGLSLLHRRYLPFFGIAAVLPLARLLHAHWEIYLSAAPRTKLQAALRRLDLRMQNRSEYLYSSVVFVFLLTFVLAARVLPGKAPSYSGISENYPYRALSVLSNEAEPRRVFHGPNWGGFVSFLLPLERAAFIDDRNELNGAEIYEEFFRANAGLASWPEIFAKYQFNYALLEAGAPLAMALNDDKGWELRFQDEKSLLYKRISEN